MRKWPAFLLAIDWSGRAASLKLELRRKLFHLGSLLFLAVYLRLGHPSTLYLMTVWLALIFIVETARLLPGPTRDLVQKVFGAIIRDKELKRYTGAFYTSLGIFAVFLFFGTRPQIVSASILYLAFGDAVSAVVGKFWGIHGYRVLGENRSWEGTAAGFAAALLCGFAVGLPARLALAGAASFSLADAIPVPPDDNLWIPLVTGATLLLLGA